MKLEWQEFKDFVTSRNLIIQGYESSEYYQLFAKDGFLMAEVRLYKNPSDTTDITDFEQNYKPTWNAIIDKLDDNGFPFFKPQVASIGWHFEPRSLDFFVGKYKSLYNRTQSGQMTIDGAEDYGDGFMLFYSADGSLLTKTSEETDQQYQQRLDANCVATKVLFTPQYDWKPIGAQIQICNKPNFSAYLWGYLDLSVVNIPILGFLQGGFNLMFANEGGTSYWIDARTTSDSPITAGLPFAILVRHGIVTDQNRFGVQVILEHFRK